MKSVCRWIVIAAAVVLLAGCGAGRQFTMPADGSLNLGVTTPADAVSMLGDPLSKSSEMVTSVEATAGVMSVFSAVRQLGTYEIYNYAFIDNTKQIWLGQLAGAMPQRLLRLVFWNGKLVGYTSMSNFQEDTTNFDDSRVAQIERGKSTEADVKALMGKPAGATIFPLIATTDGHALIYNYSEDNDNQHYAKFLAVYVDHTGIVRDMHSNDTVTPAPPRPVTPGPVIVPIITPHGK